MAPGLKKEQWQKETPHHVRIERAGLVLPIFQDAVVERIRHVNTAIFIQRQATSLGHLFFISAGIAPRGEQLSGTVEFINATLGILPNVNLSLGSYSQGDRTNNQVVNSPEKNLSQEPATAVELLQPARPNVSHQHVPLQIDSHCGGSHELTRACSITPPS